LTILRSEKKEGWHITALGKMADRKLC
jgi:hypothetical protein